MEQEHIFILSKAKTSLNWSRSRYFYCTSTKKNTEMILTIPSNDVAYCLNFIGYQFLTSFREVLKFRSYKYVDILIILGCMFGRKKTLMHTLYVQMTICKCKGLLPYDYNLALLTHIHWWFQKWSGLIDELRAATKPSSKLLDLHYKTIRMELLLGVSLQYLSQSSKSEFD